MLHVSYEDSSDLVRTLRRAGLRDVLGDDATRAAYSTDASLYRVVPRAVVRPYSVDEVVTALQVSRDLGVPITTRGAGTSVAGNAIGPGVVLDFSHAMNRVLDIDTANRTARVEAGTIHADLQRQAMTAGLRYGPDPSTHTRCTIGGMIGNNACGSRTLGYGRTSDNLVALDVVCANGDLLTTGYDDEGRPFSAGADDMANALRGVVSNHLETARTELGRFGRQVSGYAAHRLLPENRFDITQLLAGSEGTLAVTTEATVRLVTDPAHRVMVALGFSDIASAGDAAPSIVEYRPTACEGIDSRIVDVVRSRRGEGAVPPLPAGNAWLFVEIAGEDYGEVMGRAARLASSVASVSVLVVTDPQQASALWRIREDGAGLAGRAPSGLPAYAGWEDAAVPPESLGNYLRKFDELVTDYGMTSMPFGHFGDGCMHVRLDFPLDKAGGTGVFRSFLGDAADLVAGFGGSLSGEHGDGRARSELLPKMYSPDALKLFGSIKKAFDPSNLLNPGVLVDPDAVDANLRVATVPVVRRALALAYTHDDGDFSQAVHRCTGVGKCRADIGTTDVMCPSFQATREEKDSTRGRARVLQEMIRGDLKADWRSEAVHDALDLCLSCKGCASDCPTGIDMAAYKSEVLHQSYRRRLRPRAHYALGWLPRWSRIASLMPRMANLFMKIPLIGHVALFAAGVDHRRSIPSFAPKTFRQWFASTAHTRSSAGKPVLLFVDSFNNHFTPSVAEAMVDVLESAGYSPRLTPKQQCCGLTWISTGQLDAAKRILGDTIDELAKSARAGIPIVGIEPSCTGVLRSDALELLNNQASRDVAAATHTLAELLLNDAEWQAPDLTEISVVAQPHCHHHAVMGWEKDAELLSRAGAEVQRLGGCCGLAGNFGAERGHYDVSVAVAEQQLLPAVRASDASAVILADGFSCRTQLDDLSDRKGKHLAELLGETTAKPRS